ncbi:hypothetical protein A9310_13980 [Gordonia sp. UCD-TK1]|nr:hypothetical protein A9310_13980 [Gordonia sp. UCD-TK1]
MAGCRIGVSSVYKILDIDKPRSISVDEFIGLARVFETTTEELLTPVEALDQARAQELLQALDEADDHMIKGVQDSIEAHVQLFELRHDSPDLWDYVVNHHYRPGPPSGPDESPMIGVELDDGTIVKVDDTVLREALSNLHESIIRQAAAAFEAGFGE